MAVTRRIGFAQAKKPKKKYSRSLPDSSNRFPAAGPRKSVRPLAKVKTKRGITMPKAEKFVARGMPKVSVRWDPKRKKMVVSRDWSTRVYRT